jgi:Domain of unknown function (DUF4132)
MAFTIEEIEKALVTENPDWQLRFPVNAGLQQSINYPIISDYLTGKSSTLNGIQHDDKIYYWGILTNLLQNIENISSKEQLLLDVIYQPLLFPFISFNFNHWLLFNIFKKQTNSAFQAALQQFKKQGMNDDAIFQLLVFNFRYGQENDNPTIPEPMQLFLTSYIKASKNLIYPANNMYGWNNEWSIFYFKLLEEAKPEFAVEYIISGLRSDRNNPILFFSEYKGGKYMQEIIASLHHYKNADLQSIQVKFASALILYENNNQKYQGLTQELATVYLDAYSKKSGQQSWESGYHIITFENTDLSYMGYSSCALHLLFLFDKATAIQKLNDWMQLKTYVHLNTVQLIYHHLKEEAFFYYEQILKSDASKAGIEYFRQFIEFVSKHFEAAKYLPVVWQLISSKSKPLREFVAAVIANNDTSAEGRAIGLLEHKNSETRQTAAIILSHISTPEAKTAIMKVLNTESNDNARDILLQTVADNLPTAASMGFIEDMVAAAKSRGKLNKPVEPWLDENILPPLFYTTGAALTVDEKRFLFYRMSRIKEMRSDMEAKYILQFIDKDRSSDFAMAIIKEYIDKGAKPEYKFLMALAALLGNDAVVDKIRITTNKWMDENRYKMAEHGVGALALQGSDKALRWVEWYSRKYKSKKANVGTAALMALETAAEELGITIHELGDRVVPDFGFNGLFKHFIVDGDEYRAFIDSKFKIAFFNEDNKKLKVIPAAADAALKEEFKVIAKEVRDIVKSQSSRLEYYLIIQRKWNKEQWEKFFLQNPVMFIYATKLLWGTYDNEGNLQQTFMCSEDTSLLDAANDEVIIDDNSNIGIVHPSQLNETFLQQWKQVFFDASVDAIFPQLERKMPDIKDIDLSKAIIKKFEGKQMQVGSIRSTLEKYGWHKGPTGDGGMLESFNLLYFEKKIEAIMEVEGVGAGFGWGMEEKLRRLYVIDKSKVTSRWGAYIKDDADEKLIPLKDVPTIFLSEMLAAVESIKPVEK